MRITLYDEKAPYPLSDRLVVQDVELITGPKEVHKGPMVISLSLRTKEDAEKAITYIGKLIGNLPLKSKSVKLTKGTVQLDDNEPLQDFVSQAIKANAHQEPLINFLREHSFKFVMTDVITEVVPALKETIKLKEKHHKYQWMIRQIKEAKDPINDKFDHRLMFGIKLIGGKVDKVVVYLFGKFYKAYPITWKKQNAYNFKKVEQMTKFPEYMDYDDRKKWRAEHRRVLNNPNYKPTKFYTKNLPFIQIIERGKDPVS